MTAQGHYAASVEIKSFSPQQKENISFSIIFAIQLASPKREVKKSAAYTFKCYSYISPECDPNRGQHFDQKRLHPSHTHTHIHWGCVYAERKERPLSLGNVCILHI